MCASTAQILQHSFLLSFLLSFKMDYSYTPRKKKSDKAKDKAGRPSSKHVRAYEAMAERRRVDGPPPQKKK